MIAGESVEQTIRREVAEEVGLEVGSLQYSASQHWPFPNSSLMIACHAAVRPGQTEVSDQAALLCVLVSGSYPEVLGTTPDVLGGCSLWGTGTHAVQEVEPRVSICKVCTMAHLTTSETFCVVFLWLHLI